MSTEDPRYFSLHQTRDEFLYYSLLVNVLTLSFFLAFDIYQHIYIGAVTDAIALFAVTISFFSLKRGGLKTWHVHLALFGGVAICSPLLITESFENTGIYWIPCIPILLFILGGTRIGVFWLMIYSVLMLLSIIAAHLGYVTLFYNLGEISFIMLATFFMGIISYIFVRYLEQTEQIIISQQKQVETALTQAQHASQAKSHFLSTMSHDLRTPLHGIIGMQDLLSQDSQNWTTEQRESLQLALHSSHILKDLLNDVLDLAKIESGKMMVEQKKVGTLPLLREAILPFIFQAQQKGIELRLRMQHVPRNIMSDQKILRQILLNLLSNAVKFTESGYINVHVSLQSNQLLFAIKDTGIGIEEAEQSSIFEPFHQCDLSKKQRQGTGLGTTIVKQCVELLGGKIALISQIGQGSCFSFTLPCLSSSQDIHELSWGMQELMPPKHYLSKQGHAPNDIEKTLSILLVEDDRIAQRIASKSIQRSGMHVDVASNGLEALELLEKRCYDAMLTDLHMPKMDGMALTRAIRQNNLSMPIIGLSAHALSSLIDEAKEAGMNAFLSKPVSPEDIVNCIQNQAVKTTSFTHTSSTSN
ncbi:MAG: response regulator [Mariprofundaceae bacterium]|nr:response regulator [Mariprofundaceae bacterium]